MSKPKVESCLRVAISPCPNDTFTFGPLILGRIPPSVHHFSFEFHDIEELNALGMSDDAPDMLKFSYAHFPKLSKNYRLLNVGSALGKGVGPLLVGQGELSLLERTKVYVPGICTTANLLLKRYGLPEMDQNIEVEELRYDLIMKRLLEEPKNAGVIIHESRFTHESMGINTLMDLGQRWELGTKLPLPLGGIGVHRRWSEIDAKGIEESIKNSLAQAWETQHFLLPMMKSHAQEMDEEVMLNHVQLYVNEFTKDLGSLGLKAIQEICQMKSLKPLI